MCAEKAKKLCVTRFIMIFTLLWWSGTNISEVYQYRFLCEPKFLFLWDV